MSDATAPNKTFISDPGDEDDDAGDSSSTILPLAKDENAPVPALRDVLARIVNVAGDDKEKAGENEQPVVLLEDPEGLAPKPAIISTWAYAMASLFNGERTPAEVAVAFEEQYGQKIEVPQVLDLQRELDKALFLFSKRFERSLKKQIHTYLNNVVRPATHAGSAYPVARDALQKTIEGFFSSPGGPGSLADIPQQQISRKNTVRALVLPHIDLQVGGATYAHGYRELICNSEADLFFILGVAHQNPGQNLFNVSLKDFETPFGVLKTEHDIALALQTASGANLTLAELAHRTEHSVEFQAVLLMSLLSERYKRNIQIVPILCGSVDHFLTNETNPMKADVFIRFKDALRTEIDKCKRNWCVLCSVDFSHVGPEFGHSTMMSEHMLPAVERADKKLLKAMEHLDADSLFQEIARTKNSRHVDAVMAVLTLLQSCDGMLSKGRLLHYDQMLKDKSHSVVSYASMVFES